MTADDVAQHIKQLLKDLGGYTKSCALAVSEPGSLLRIIEQPNTPPALLRNALRYNGLSMLNQDCKDFVLDVASISNGISGANGTAGEGQGAVAVQVQAPATTQTRYLVGRSEEHTSELQSLRHLVCRLLLEKKKEAARRERPRWDWLVPGGERRG